jgi:uroporphyrinogen III methyltransferase/synthase
MTKVYLVGAGPGDASLITLRGIQVLKKADIVLYDHLANPSFLNYCKKNTQLIHVGKQKGHHSVQQKEINQHLIDYAKGSTQIVRLKGGDPLIFGRGGEEMEVLKKNNIPYEIVPGITSAIAVPAYAGIPLTHRHLSRSVAFVTGTLEDGNGIQKKLLPDADTLVFLMAISNLKELCELLIQNTRFEYSTPAALIYNGTTASQKTVLGTLSTIYEKKESEGMTHPSILVVGNVAQLSQSLSWQQYRPLSGKRVIVTRQKEKSSDIMERLCDLGADVIHMPMIEITQDIKEKKRLTKKLLESFTDIVFTSSNGVDVFFDVLYQEKLDLRLLHGKSMIAVGPKTAECLKKRGIQPDWMPKEMYSSESIKNLFYEDLTGRHIAFPVGKKASRNLANHCRKKGGQVTILPIYDTISPVHIKSRIEPNDIIIFTSPTTVSHLIKSKKWTTQHIVAITIGPTTTAELKKHHHSYTLIEANETTTESIISSLVEYVQN